ncbi:class I SAM-dependent methyltransferase [Solirubrobacter phytolaccae]|uniref:Class I SAM-dependent methyltransferase n=1 Tax=Solirubrobacter phytolaccae TaxID=1404360 RepID=A0A9X3NCT3_9ACTN|nr:class I SAM-dependent methyltransferase [Solirubrobacter phytolaccae]MDA0182505.1 class I SAM-dependent methyltransferase [Solirubrobacter phytolaccae]
MRQFYEDFWADAPDEDGEPYAWEQRRGLLTAELRPDDRVLDYGCGTGRFLALLDDGAGVEIAEHAVERARATGADVRLLETDGTIPFGHGEFDLVWCSEVLEHIPDVAFALSELRRVLKPGGRLLLTVPFHGRLQAAWIALTRFEAHFDPLGQHVRFFTRRSLTEALITSGFTPAVHRAGELLVARAERG